MKRTAACMLAAAVAFPGTAAAVSQGQPDPARDALQERVEQSAREYDSALARVEEERGKAQRNKEEMQEIEDQLPTARARAAKAARTLYRFTHNRSFALESVLASGGIAEIITACDYLDAVSSHTAAQIQQLACAERQLAAKQERRDRALERAEEAALEAEEALKEAEAARQEAEARALEEARRQARQAEAEARAEARALGRGNARTPGALPTVAQEDVDWSLGRQEFVDEWAPRIDAYLAGFPLEGQGAAFASAAWDNGVDPRWSPAISCVESTKGTYCFRPCNAWGWGDYSFASWEEAIAGHVAYLGDMYGSTVTPDAAGIYCPPNADFWYRRCVEEMGLM